MRVCGLVCVFGGLLSYACAMLTNSGVDTSPAVAHYAIAAAAECSSCEGANPYDKCGNVGVSDHSFCAVDVHGQAVCLRNMYCTDVTQYCSSNDQCINKGWICAVTGCSGDALCQPKCEDAPQCTLGSATGCSTDIAAGLTAQIIEELKLMGYTFSPLDGTLVKCSGACVPMLQSSAAKALHQAARLQNKVIPLTSAFRSSAQQYLLYKWGQTKSCGIGLVGKPGKSGHESGRSVDTAQFKSWSYALKSSGFKQSYPINDPVHFDHMKSMNMASDNLRAFQRVWNRNNPNDIISEDGMFGPATIRALNKAPCNGW